MRHSISILLLLVACGDNKEMPDARQRADSGPPDSYVPSPRAVAVAGDFGSPGVGVLSALEVDGLTMRHNIIQGAVQGDPVLRQFENELFVINRFGSNNVTLLDAKTFILRGQWSTGANSNPQDVAVVGDKLYVPALGTEGVVVITRATGAMTTIDLSSLDTRGMNDGMPECVSAYAVGTKVFVACGMLDNFSPNEPGKVAVIDTATDTMVAEATLPYENPYGFFVKTPVSSTFTGDLLIGTVPDLTNYATGCIARVSTGTTPTAGCGPTLQELGGFANKLSVDPAGEVLYVAVGTYDSAFMNPTGRLRGVDLESGMIWNGALSDVNELIIDAAACPGGQVVAMDQKFNMSGIRVWRDLAERTAASALTIGLPPTVNALVCYDP